MAKERKVIDIENDTKTIAALQRVGIAKNWINYLTESRTLRADINSDNGSASIPLQGGNGPIILLIPKDAYTLHH